MITNSNKKDIERTMFNMRPVKKKKRRFYDHNEWGDYLTPTEMSEESSRIRRL